MKCKQMELDIVATPSIVIAAAVPSNFQHEITKFQTDDTLYGMYVNAPLIQFYQRYVNAYDVPILWEHALKHVPLFGSAYCCEQFFFLN